MMSKKGLACNLSYENEGYLHVNENSRFHTCIKFCCVPGFALKMRVKAFQKWPFKCIQSDRLGTIIEGLNRLRFYCGK